MEEKYRRRMSEEKQHQGARKHDKRVKHEANYEKHTNLPKTSAGFMYDVSQVSRRSRHDLSNHSKVLYDKTHCPSSSFVHAVAFALSLTCSRDVLLRAPPFILVLSCLRGSH